MEREKIVKQQALFEALYYYGLLQDLKIVEDSMRGNEPLPTNGNGTLKNFWNKNVLNESRRRTMRKLSELKNNILNAIAEFKAKNEESGLDYRVGESKELLIKNIEDVFCGDNANISKVMFSLQFCLDSKVKFENKEAVNAEISSLLFGDRYVIANLYNNLEENYIQLYRAPIKKIESVVLKGLGISALIAIALPPLVLGGTAITALTVPALLDSVLVGIGIGVVATAELAATYSAFLLGGVLVGTEIAKLTKTREAKESLRKATPEDLSLLLAIKATIIQYCKTTMDNEEMKLALDDCLKQLNDLRADAEYLLIVEKLDANKSKKKLHICNNFTDRLVNIVGL